MIRLVAEGCQHLGVVRYVGNLLVGCFMSHHLVQTGLSGYLLFQGFAVLPRLIGTQIKAFPVGLQVVGKVERLQHLVRPQGCRERAAHEDDADGYLQTQHHIPEKVCAATPHVGCQSLLRPADARQRHPDDEGTKQEEQQADAEAVPRQVPDGEGRIVHQVGKVRIDKMLHPTAHQHGHGHRQAHHDHHLGKEQAEQLAATCAVGDAQRHLASAHPEELHLHAQKADEGGYEDERADEVYHRLDGDYQPDVTLLYRTFQSGPQAEGLQADVQLLQ